MNNVKQTMRHNYGCAWLALLALLTPAAASEYHWDFETDSSGWTALGCVAKRSDADAKDGSRSLAVSRTFPGAEKGAISARSSACDGRPQARIRQGPGRRRCR